MLGAMEGASPDPNDPATSTCTAPPNRDYTQFLRTDALRGARIGIPRANYYDPITLPGDSTGRGGINAAQRKVMDDAIAVLVQQGAIIVDPANIQSVVTPNRDRNLLVWGGACSGLGSRRGRDASCSISFKYGMKRDFNLWLQSLGAAAPVKSLTELRTWNVEHQLGGAIKYGQAQLDISDEMDVERDRSRYEADRAKDIALGGAEGIDAALKEHNLDALLFPGSGGAGISARPGYPTVIVPFGMVPNAPQGIPAGFDPKPSPIGVSFAGTACSEPRLLALAYAFEQATKRRAPPPEFP
jgi:amidase